MRAIPSLLSLSLLAGCASLPDVLSEADLVSLRASIDALQPVRDQLPVSDPEIEDLGVDFVAEAIELGACPREGIMGGVWYGAGTVEGAWFRVGTSDLGGTVDGTYGDGAYAGTALGEDLEAEVTGTYADGLFVGDWQTVEADAPASGELIGRYEARNEIGGYFFGVWSRCD